MVNVLTSTQGAAVVTAWIEDPRTRKISFTGSTPVGRQLLRQAAERVVNASMELGGNATFVVTADAGIDAAVAGAMVAKFRNGGQACTAANRFLIHEDVVERFTDDFGRAISQLRVGPATDPETEVGPLISAQARADLARLVDQAIADGARVAARADAPDGGCFYPPTLLADVPPSSLLVTEIFGPVAPVVTWRDTDELLSHVNGTEAGLASYVYAGDLGAALRLAERSTLAWWV